MLQRYVVKPHCKAGHSPTRGKYNGKCCASWEAEISHKHLEGDNKRSVGTRYHSGLSDRLPISTTAKHSTSLSTVLCRADPINSGRGQRTSRQGSHKGSSQPSRRVLLKPVSCPKERRRTETGDKPKSSEQLCSDRAFQNGGNPYIERSSQSRGLVGKSGSEGCILRNPDPPIPPPVLEVHIPGKTLSVSVPTIWPVIGTMGLYQDPKASTSPPPGNGGTTDSIHRRYPCPGGVQGTSKESCRGSSVPSAMSGFQSKPKEIDTRTSPSDRIPGFHCRHSPNGVETPSGQDKEDPGGVTGYDKRGKTGLGKSPCSFGGKDERDISSHSTGSTILPPLTDGPVCHTKSTPSVLRSSGPPDNRVQGRIDVVGHPHDQLEWEVPPQEGSGHDNRLRCFTDRLGSNQSEPTDRRSMVSDRTGNAHKLSGAVSCNTSSQDIPEKQNQDVSSPQVRQHHGSGIHKQPGRNSLQGVGRLSQVPMDVVPGEEHPHHSPTPTRCSERDSRCGVSDYDRSVRLAVESSHFRQDCQGLGSDRDGSVCVTPDGSVPSLFQLAARSLCSGDRCLSAGLVSDQGLCQPTLESDRSGSIQSTDGPCPHYSGSTNLEDATLVPPVTANVNCSSTSDHSRSDNVEQRPGGPRPSASRMAYLRERYRDQELSEEATSLMLNSWRTKTNKSYDSLFGKWHSWCCGRGSDPFSGPIKEVVNFLANLHKEGYQYRSLNSYRSAISSVHEKIDGHTVGQHPLVTRLMKGVFNDRPPLPRYTCTWNVQTVLSYISSWGSNDSLSLKQLSWKTAMLLALTRPSRSADLSQLSLSGKQYKPAGVTFTPSSLAKQSRQGKPITEFFFPSFQHDSGLCPVVTLKAYEERTVTCRGAETKLFLALIKPHKAVTSSTIARWLKSLLEAAGIDTSVFTAHSVRGASSSAAANLGITTNDILKAADWSSESVFQRFYYKPTEDPSYGRAVLSTTYTRL